MANIYYRGQGKVYAAVRDALGNPGPQIWLGNVEALDISLQTDTQEHRESYSGSSNIDLRLVRGITGSIKATLDNYDLDALSLGLYGTKSSVTGATVTSEALPSTLAVGDEVALANPLISALTITDSAGTPATLVAGTDYQIVDANYGRIKILNLGAYTKPFNAAYTYGNRTESGMFTQPVPERWLRFEGLNKGNLDTPVVVDLYRVALDPLSQLGVIGNDIAKYDLNGSLLLDSTKAANSAIGQFGAVRYLA